jgi:dTDP-4-dehydrorhamnose 3,5-epimerase
MIFEKTKIEGVYIITQEPRIDERGYFSRIFAKEELMKHGIAFNVKHGNRSLSKDKGTVRGMHYQTYPKQEDKIVHCIKGAIFDVAIDLRKKSKTYGQWVGEILTGENRKMLLVPKGFAHGFQTLEKDCLVEYFVTQYYAPKYEQGIRWDDPAFGVDWPIKKAIVSDKDGKWALFVK